MGYNIETKGYHFYDLITKRLIISHDVVFDEKSEWKQDKKQGCLAFLQTDEFFDISITVMGDYNGESDTSNPTSPSSFTSSISSSTPLRK